MEDDHLLSSHWRDDMDDTQWLELLGPFTALKIFRVKSHDVSAVPFKGFQEKGQLKCYPRYAIFP